MVKLKKLSKQELLIRLKNLLQFQFVYYGAKDVYLLKRLDDKINITNILLSMSSV